MGVVAATRGRVVRVVAVVRVMTVVAVMRMMGVVPHRRRAAVAVRKGQQRRRGRSRGLGDGSLRPSNAEAGVGDLRRRALREHRRERDSQRYEKWLLLHELVTICVPICDCQAIGRPREAAAGSA